MDGSHFKFVDDLLRFLLVRDGSADSARALMRESDDALDAALAPTFAQNRGKQESTPDLGAVQNRRLATSDDIGAILPHMRHLGGRFSAQGSFVAERAVRIQACNIGWCTFRSYWGAEPRFAAVLFSQRALPSQRRVPCLIDSYPQFAGICKTLKTRNLRNLDSKERATLVFPGPRPVKQKRYKCSSPVPTHPHLP